MSHPTEQLADYVDGTLSPQARSGVEAHLSGCAQCRAEVEQARMAKDALKRLPDLMPPAGISKGLAAEPQQVDAPGSVERPGPRMAYRVVAGLAAAALVGLFAFAILARSNSGGPAADSAAQEKAPEVAAPATGDLAADGDYTGLELKYLADREVAVAKRGSRSSTTFDEQASDTTSNEVEKPQGWLAGNTKVERCLRKAGAYESGGTLRRAFEAKLTGIPAYFGVIETGEAPGDPVDRIVIWVAAKKGCDVLGFAQAYIVRPSPSPFPEELEGITPPAVP